MVNLLDILKNKRLVNFIGLKVSSFLKENPQFDVVIDNGEESKVLVNESYELSTHFDKIVKAKLNFTNGDYCLKSERVYPLPKIEWNDLLTCLVNEQIQYELVAENVNDGFKLILLESKIRIYYDTEKESIWSLECGES